MAGLTLRAGTLGALLGLAAAASTSPIKYIIVVMQENRSFDHLLGHLGLTDPRIDGISSNYSNPINASDPNSKRVYVGFDAVDGGPVDPKHDFDSIVMQMFGTSQPNNLSQPTMNGFAQVATDEQYAFVMSAFNDSNLPVMSALAREYAVFDHWHANPTPTNPNREFVMSGTSHGMIDNTLPDVGFPQQTHFNFLEQHGLDWSIYYNDDPWMAPAFVDLRTPASLARIQEMPAFFQALQNGTLARYTFIQPRMASSSTGPSNWQHPDNSVQAGEAFYGEIYNALRNSTYWNESILILGFDEHGGFSDHQLAPTEGIPSPDGIVASNGFKFDRLGVRIPYLAISPWIPKNTVVGPPSAAQKPTATSQWDHTSVISTVNRLFGIQEHLTARDAWAAHFDDLLVGEVDAATGERRPRTDCPLRAPEALPLPASTLALEMEMQLNDHHLDSLNLLCHLSGHAHAICTGYAQPGQRDAVAAQQLQVAPTPGAAPLPQWPHLFAPLAVQLRQRHFEQLSKHMWAVYREGVMAGSAGATAA